MKINAYILIAFFSINMGAWSQTEDEACACCKPEYQQFDFWIGEWDVFNVEGKKVGENSITVQQENCLIQENWSGTSKITGTSYSFYDRVDSTWNQVYISNTGDVLWLKGGVSGEKMVLKSNLVKSKKSDLNYYNQITWSKDTDGNVLQKWEIFSEKDVLLQVAFEGLYKLKSN